MHAAAFAMTLMSTAGTSNSTNGVLVTNATDGSMAASKVMERCSQKYIGHANGDGLLVRNVKVGSTFINISHKPKVMLVRNTTVGSTVASKVMEGWSQLHRAGLK